jgi:predicted PurR-regulated permease PerM
VAIALGRQMTFWVAALIVTVLALWILRGVLLPFVAGMALAYLFNPLATKLEGRGVNRVVAALLIIGFCVLTLVALLLLIVPVLAGQLWALIENLPAYARRVQSLLAESNNPWLQRVLGGTLKGSDTSVGDIVSQGAGWLATFLKSLWSGGQALISVLSLMIVTPVVAFYLLCDWDRMLRKLDSWVPLSQGETVRALAREIDDAIAGFVRGQSGVCLILGSFYAVGLSLVGLNFGLLIGLGAGLVSFIPYIGSMSGLVISTGVAVAQFWPEWTPIILVLCIFFVGQFLEGYILAPKLVGERIGLHPVWLMFALFAFGYLFGFVGLLLAVPLAAAVGVIARFGVRRYLASPFYTGEPPPAVTRAPGPQALPRPSAEQGR